MERPAPAVVFVLSVDVLLLSSEHEPVEGAHDEVADNGQGVKHVVPGLEVDGGVRSLKGVLAEIYSVIACTDATDK